MAGFSLEGVYYRIPCPYCRSTDCCGISADGQHLICGYTAKVVTAEMLQLQAGKHGMTRYQLIEAGGGWYFRLFTFVTDEDASWVQIGNVELYNETYGVRGLCPDMPTAQVFVQAHPSNLSASYP